MKRYDGISKVGVDRRSKWQEIHCPFCHARLSRRERIRRNVLRICKCNHCGKIINERYIVR